MSEAEKDGVIFQPTGIMHTEGGAMTNFQYAPTGDVSHEQAREIIVDAHGIDPDSVQLDGADTKRTAASRISVGFSKWRSSWDPHTEREKGTDPTLN